MAARNFDSPPGPHAAQRGGPAEALLKEVFCLTRGDFLRVNAGAVNAGDGSLDGKAGALSKATSGRAYDDFLEERARWERWLGFPDDLPMAGDQDEDAVTQSLKGQEILHYNLARLKDVLISCNGYR